MSGSNALPPIQVKIDGAQAAQQAIDGLTAAADRMGAASARTAGQVGALRTQAEQAAGASRNFGTIIGQAGFQVQDFAVQVASGQSALTAFVQQGSQLAGIFGPAGIIAGAALAVAGIAIQFLTMGENAEQAQRRAEAAFKGMAEAGRDTAAVLRDINALFLTAGQRAAALANANVQVLRTDALRQQDIAVQRQEGAIVDLAQAQRDLAALERGMQRRRDETFARTGSRVGDYTPRESAELFAARARVAGLEAEITRQGARAGELAEALRRLDNAGIISQGGEEFGPPAPERRRGGGGASRDPRQFGPLDGSPQSIAALERGRVQAEEREARAFDQEQERREREVARSQERAIAANQRTTDSIVDYGAKAFADMFDKNGRGFDGLMENLERTAKQTLARIAAELILRPIIAPIVQTLGLGMLGTGNGGFSGFGGLVGGGGYSAGGVTGGGGMVSSGGGMGGIGSLFNMGGGSGLGGFMSNPIWQPGVGFFASQAAGTNAALAAMGPGVYGPAVPAASSGTLGAMGSVSLGTYAAGIGIGYMGGSMLGGYLAGNSPARQTNAQIGAGGGAVSGALAGAAIGSVVPVIGTAVGAIAGGIIGGLGGGAAGGSIGPGRGFAGGDVGIGVDANGLLSITGAGGKRWDGGAATQQATAQVEQINTLLRASGVRIEGAGGFAWDRGGSSDLTIGFMGFGESKQRFGPTEIFQRVRGNLTSANDNMRTALRSSAVNSFEDVGNVAQWLTTTYEPLSKAIDYTNRYSEALAGQMRVYDLAIARAKELGLAEGGLVDARKKMHDEILGERNRVVSNAVRALRADELRQTGNAKDARQASLIELAIGASDRRVQMRDFLRANGYGDDTDLFKTSMSRIDALYEKQRSTLANDIAGNPGASFMQELTVGGLGGIAPAARFAAGMKVLQEARSSGNLDRITAAARSVLPVARDYLGTSERYGRMVAGVAFDVRRLGGDPLSLSDVFKSGQDATNMTLDRIYTMGGDQLAELKGMRVEISRLNAVITTLIQRKAA